MEVGISNKNVVLNGNPLIRKSEFKGWWILPCITVLALPGGVRWGVFNAGYREIVLPGILFLKKW
jgi:hypothetical protein